MRRMRNLVFFGFGAILFACSPGPSEPTEPPQPVEELAPVESLEVLRLNTSPVEIQVVARGDLPDSCTLIDSVEVDREGDAFIATIRTARPAELVCTQVLVPYERVLPLDVRGLAAGTYRVSVNEASTTFDLDESDFPPTATPNDPATGSIRGLVWHDLCGMAGEGEEAVVTDGCGDPGDGSLAADGQLDDGEPALEGVEVSLSEGACPQFPSLESVSDSDGEFSFSGLRAGTYCLFIDPLLPGNRQGLMPGRWTYPALDTGWYEIELGVTESAEDLNFGWDFERLPPVNFEGCLDNAQFVRDVTVPDDTIFLPGEVFTKTWLIRNIGTCHWVDGYSLVYAAGDRLSGETASLPTVLAGEDIEVSVVLQAPDVEGEFRGDWQLENPSGERFGTLGDFELTLFLRIIVEAAEVDTPAIQGTVWADACDPEPAEGEESGCVEDADGNLIGNGVFDEGEAGIEEVWVNLYQGTCASRGDSIDSSVTDVDGLYLFEGLDVGIYCVVVDALAVENLPVLGTGLWTHPALNVSTINVTMAADELRDGIAFGWYFTEE